MRGARYASLRIPFVGMTGVGTARKMQVGTCGSEHAGRNMRAGTGKGETCLHARGDSQGNLIMRLFWRLCAEANIP